MMINQYHLQKASEVYIEDEVTPVRGRLHTNTSFGTVRSSSSTICRYSCSSEKSSPVFLGLGLV